jgi:hypothetical protein
MSIDFASAQRDVAAVLQAQGLAIAANALKPLQRISFKDLVSIHDHEEHFLKTVFLDSLVSAHRARMSEGEGGPEITLQDIRTAMLMLGTAAASAPEQQLSGASKSIIKDICPYCATVQMRQS